MLKTGNLFWKACIAEGVTPKEFGEKGLALRPDSIETPFHVWMDIMTGKADGQQMFMEQKYRVKGDFSLLMRMNQLFGR